MKAPKTPGPLTPMPSVKLDLGRYVTVRKRADGSHRVLFEVPPRLRPSGWSATIPLPVEGTRTGDLTNADELARIKRDAARLYNQLQRVRAGQPAEPQGRSLKMLVRTWQVSSAWKALAPTSRKHYEAYIRNVLAWAEAAGEPDPTTMDRAAVEGFLALFDDRPATKKHTHKAMRLIMEHAIGLKWRDDNPCDKIRVKLETTRADIWEQADVDAYVAAAKEIGRESIALMVLMEWEIGQRVTDARSFRPGAEYEPEAGVFRFRQSKTDSYVTVPVSLAVRAALAPEAKGNLFLFRDESTDKPYTAERLVVVFDKVRQVVTARGGRALKLRWLRHSCVVQLARSGCTHLEIAAITGHAPNSVGRILSTYLPRDNQVAWNAQKKRGLVDKRRTKVGRVVGPQVRRSEQDQ
jgi:site-specific recombinase XerD